MKCKRFLVVFFLICIAGVAHCKEEGKLAPPTRETRITSAKQVSLAFIQSGLNILGYKVGNIDGRMGGKTVRGIKQFQKDNGLYESGKINFRTQRTILDKIRKIDIESSIYNRKS